MAASAACHGINDVNVPAGFVLRPMQPSDAQALASLASRIMPFAWPVATFASCMAEPYRAIVLQEKSSLVGFVIARVQDEECELVNIGVDLTHQRRGLGCFLLQSFVDTLRASGVRQVWLEVRCSNQAAIDLYERFGFIKISVRKDYYPSANGRESAYLMRLDLMG